MATTRTFGALVPLLFAYLAAVASTAEPTHVDLRVLSKGGKFVGSSTGGIEATLRDADTGELLAAARGNGNTGLGRTTFLAEAAQ